MTTPEPLSSGRFGAHVWIREGAYSFEGYQGQWVTVVPSERLVVVRLGVNESGDPYPWDQKVFLKRIIDGLPR
jgi:hypothetical protein